MQEALFMRACTCLHIYARSSVYESMHVSTYTCKKLAVSISPTFRPFTGLMFKSPDYFFSPQYKTSVKKFKFTGVQFFKFKEMHFFQT